jgi:alpha-L-fucosidase
VVATQKAEISTAAGPERLTFHGELIKTGDVDNVKVGFQFREYAGFVEELYSDEWQETETIEISEGKFNLRPAIEKDGKTYQYRAFADHPKLRVYGDFKRITF